MPRVSKKDGLEHIIWRDGVGNPNAVPLTDYRVTVYTSDIRGAGEGAGGGEGETRVPYVQRHSRHCWSADNQLNDSMCCGVARSVWLKLAWLF